MVDAFNLTVLKGLPFTVTGSYNVNPAANVQTFQPGEKAVVGGGDIWQLTLDLGAAVPLRQFAVLYTDAVVGSPQANWYVTASNNPDGFTAPLLSSGQLFVEDQAALRPAGYRHYFYHAPVAATARYVRFVGGGPLQIGRVMVGNPIQLNNNPDYGETSWGYDEADEPELLDSGVEVLYEDIPAPVFNFTATWVSQAEMDADWEPLARLQHEGVPVLVARRPDAHATRHNGLYYGRLRMIPIVAQDFDLYEVQGRVRSMV